MKITYEKDVTKYSMGYEIEHFKNYIIEGCCDLIKQFITKKMSDTSSAESRGGIIIDYNHTGISFFGIAYFFDGVVKYCPYCGAKITFECRNKEKIKRGE